MNPIKTSKYKLSKLWQSRGVINRKEFRMFVFTEMIAITAR